MDNIICRRSWIEINLNILKKNVYIYKNQLKCPAAIMAVIKANAYGHGDIEVAKELQKIGIDLFAVSNVLEAISLREAGIKGEILILGYTPIEQIPLLLEYDITQALISDDYAQMVAYAQMAANQNEQRLKVQFALDTGMNRVGLDVENLFVCEQTIRKYASIFRLTGLFTHLCVADSPKRVDIEFTKKQIHKFEELVEKLDDLKLPFIHCMNSAGGLWHTSKYDSIIRLGIIMYGLKPDYLNQLPKGIKPMMQWKTVVSRIENVKIGETIGYGRSYVVEKDMVVATLPTGYADGYNRQLSNKGYVLIKGKKAPVVGRICMDQMMVDITDIKDVSIGDEVVLIGDCGEESISADMMAQMIGTIGYEILCDISNRVQRLYIIKRDEN